MKVWHALSIAALLSSPEAAAQPAPYSVEITAAGSQQPVTPLEARTRALLQDYPVAIDWSVRAEFHSKDVFEVSEHAALARIWFDLRQSSRIVLYLVDEAHERFLVRVVPLEAGYDEIACESVGTIVQSSVEALLAGATVGVTREAAEEQASKLEAAPPPASPPAPPPAAPPTPPEPRSEPYRLAADLSYRAQLLAEGPQLLHGPELGASLTRAGRGLAGAGFLALGYRLPLLWQEQGVGVNLEGFGLRGGPGLRLALGSRVHLALLGVFGVEVLEIEPTSADPMAQARAPFWLVAPMLGAALEVDVDLTGPLSLWLSAGAEGDLSGNHFDVLEDGEPIPVLQTWAVQPVLRLGLRLRP